MFEIDKLKDHKLLKKISDTICYELGVSDSDFVTVLTSYTLCKLAAMMHTKVVCGTMQPMLVNAYAVCIAPSGYGKGYACKILRENVVNKFNDMFKGHLFDTIAENNLQEHAYKQAERKRTSIEDEYEYILHELMGCGVYYTQFDSGTNVGLKQLRRLVQIAKIGSLNLEVDEIGAHLNENKELLDTCLELYDGTVNSKLIKNTKDDIRRKELDEKTPTNVLLFGNGNALFDGGSNEKMFKALSKDGYARRCFFGFSDDVIEDRSFQELYTKLTNVNTFKKLEAISSYIETLCNIEHYNRDIALDDESIKTLIHYRIYCNTKCATYKEHEELYKIECKNRYFKALRLAAALAFIDKASTVTKEHMLAAIKVTEISANCMRRIFSTDSLHIRLAKYIANADNQMTHADLLEELSFYPKAAKAQEDLWKLAIAYGYKHNIVIKRSFVDDIEFFEGETIVENDPNSFKAIISYTVNEFEGASDNYINKEVSLPKLIKFFKQDKGHWLNHHLKDGVRSKDNVVEGFNVVVLDVDGSTPINIAKTILKKYMYFMYTTKKHTVEENRYRIIIPLSHTLHLSSDDYKQFVTNIMNHIPIETDECAKQCSRKWRTYEDSTVFTNKGELFDVLQYIPRTKKNEKYLSSLKDVQNLGSLERYFYLEFKEGSRNNLLFRYAMLLVDLGYSLDELSKKVNTLNKASKDPLSNNEIQALLNNSRIQDCYSKKK